MSFCAVFRLVFRLFSALRCGLVAAAFWLLAPSAFAAATEAQSAKTSSAIAANKAASAQLSRKLEDIAAEIVSGEKALDKLEAEEKALQNSIASLQKLAGAQNSELDVIILQNKDLMADKAALEQRLVGLIAREFAYDLIAPADAIDGAASVVNREVLKALGQVMKGDLQKLVNEYNQALKKIESKQQQIAKVNDNIKEFKQKSNELKNLQAKQQQLLAKQREDEAAYKKRLNALAIEQSELQQTLEKLKILKQKEADMAKRAAEEKQRQIAAAAAQKEAQKAAKKAAADASSSDKSAQPAAKPIDASDVRHASELGHAGAVGKYRGKKLIAPLEQYTVKQGFGYYIDPVYKLKIFNENVVLRSSSENANVRVVADGRVVYVGDTPVLEKVVIVEHAAGLHSIYAHMDKFSRLAKVGTRLRAGNVVGKVRRDLTFEMTQKSAHIDPLTAIKR